MLGFEISILERKVEDIEKRIEALEAFVKILKKQYECDPVFLVPSEGFMRGEEKK